MARKVTEGQISILFNHPPESSKNETDLQMRYSCDDNIKTNFDK